MAVPVAPNIAAPIALGPFGPRHQIVKAPRAISATPSYYNPVPVASQLKGGTTGTAYSETIGAQGGTTPYTYATSGGALPTGTTLNSATGVISGTPSAAGTFSFNITVTDANSYTGTQGFSIVMATAATGGGNYGYVA